jgi:hypothetical protein
MAFVPPEFVNVDMRGLKAALVERAHSDGISVSALVRGAVAARLGFESESGSMIPHAQQAEGEGGVRLLVRLSRPEAECFEANAAAAGVSRGKYLAQLMADVQPLNAVERAALIDAIVASNETVSTLNRNVRHLTELLSRGSVKAALEYRAMLDTLAGDVRRHLSLVGAGLQVLLPGSRGCAPTTKHGRSFHERAA